MSALYNIKEEYKHLLSLIDEEMEENGELSQETAEALVINKEQLIEKVQNYKWVMDTLKSHAAMAKEEIDRVTAFQKSAEAKRDRFEAALLQALLLYGEEDKNGIKRLEVGTLKLSTRRSKSIEVYDETEVPAEYKKTSIVINDADRPLANKALEALKIEFDVKDPVVNKTLIKEAIQKNVEVPAAEQVTKVGLTLK